MTEPVQLSQVVELPDVLVDNHFSLYIPIVPGGGDSDALWVRSMNGVLPGQSNAVTKLTLHRLDTHYANRKKQPQSFRATYVDMSDRKVIDAFKNWQAQITDPLTGLPRPRDTYQVKGEITLFGADNQPVEIRDFYRLWVSDVQDSGLNGQSENNPLQIQVTFTYDYWLPRN
jgi:hypothetical protein